MLHRLSQTDHTVGANSAFCALINLAYSKHTGRYCVFMRSQLLDLAPGVLEEGNNGTNQS